ncbi:MAG TPA: glycosyltransferase [Spirochaetota bacterium]|nr:glycosyltransferase [Spirochaetota bacterium]HOL58160.1 glycosyltransferase [Spirochaetota bacterium]HPP05620.1 glycosyltransferase [Spirochaetota bacterium]
MNIALFTDCYKPIKNGVVTSVLQLKDGLEEKGHNVFVITVEVPNYIEKDENIYRMQSFKVGLGTEQRFGLFHQGPINRFLLKKNIQLIHTHTEFSIGYCGKWAAKKLKIPHIHTTHTMWEDYRHYILNGKLISRNLARNILKAFLKRVFVIIAPSIKAKKYYQELVPDIPVKVIPNGIDIQKFKSSKITNDEISQLRKEFNLKKNDKILIFVGRIGKEKRVMELFDTIVPIIKSNPNVKMLFVGDGPQLPELMRKAKEANLEKEFIFTGFVNWELVYRLYSISSIFVTASLSEVHPMTLIEATMCGLPIITRRDDSYLDLVNNGVNGYLVDTDEEISSCIQKLLNDNKLLEMFSDESYNISQKFTAENHVNKVEALYNKVLECYPDVNKIREFCELD